MKHTTLLLSFFVFATLITISTSGQIVRAQDTTATNGDDSRGRMLEERRDMMTDNRTERRDMMENSADERRGFMQGLFTERREEMQTRFDEFRKARIGDMIEMMTKRFAWAIERLENIADRIEARIEKIETETGERLTDARAHLDEARTHIASATRLLDEITADVDYLTADDTKTDERFTGFRDAFANVKAEIKAAWTSLREALQAIKNRRADDNI